MRQKVPGVVDVLASRVKLLVARRLPASQGRALALARRAAVLRPPSRPSGLESLTQHDQAGCAGDHHDGGTTRSRGSRAWCIHAARERARLTSWARCSARRSASSAALVPAPSSRSEARPRSCCARRAVVQPEEHSPVGTETCHSSGAEIIAGFKASTVRTNPHRIAEL